MIHQGFIANRTVPAIANYLYQKYQAQNKTQTSKWRRISREAANDIDIDSEKRSIRNQRSLNLDLESISSREKWQHSEFIEQYDTEWKRDDFLD